MSETTSIPDKKRMQWLDVSRVVCMLLIVFMHFQPVGWEKFPAQLFIASGVPFYLFWSGYFCAGNTSWKKIFHRSFLFLCVYIIWEILAWLAGWHYNSEASFFGIGQYIVPQTPGGGALPYIAPLWFIRDLIILTLLTPFIVKLRVVVIPCILVFMSYQSLSIPHEPVTVISVGTCLIYIIGCYARNYKIAKLLSEQKSRHLAIFFFIAFILTTSIAIKNNIISGDSWGASCWKPTLFGYLCGTALISTFGILCMRYLPYIGERIAKLAPAMLFVLILHMPLGDMLNIRFWLPGAWSILQAPLLMTICLALFFLLRKFIPWAMPYIAATK